MSRANWRWWALTLPILGAVLASLAPDAAWAGYCTNLADCVQGDRGGGRMLLIGAGAVAGVIVLLMGEGAAHGPAQQISHGFGEEPPPLGAAELEKNIADAKARFEELQDQLKAEAGRQTRAIDKFQSDYDRLWTEAIKGTEDYMDHYPEILRDLEGLWEAVADRKWAKEVAEWVDVGIQAAMMGIDAYHMGAAGLKAAGLIEGAAGAAARESEILAGRTAAAMERDGAAGARAAEEAVAARRAEEAAAGAREQRELSEAMDREHEAYKRAQAAREAEMNAAIEREAQIARAEREASDAAEAAERAKAAEQVPPQTAAEREKAIADSGMTAEHGEAFGRIARERDEVVLTQATNRSATANIEQGAATKSIHIKGKSATDGPAEGYIPTDQSLTPKVAEPNKTLIREFGGNPEQIRADLIAEHGEAYVAEHGPKLIRQRQVENVVQHYNEEVRHCIEEGYAVPKEIIGKNGERVTVLADPRTGRPITADYDLLATGTRKPEMLQVTDPDLGNITAGGPRLNNELNTAVVDGNRAIDNPVVHHGPANTAPTDPGINYPVTAYQPDGRIVSITDQPKLVEYFNTMNGQGYKMAPHPDWGWQRDPQTYQWVLPK